VLDSALLKGSEDMSDQNGEMQSPVHLCLRVPASGSYGLNGERIIQAHNETFDAEGSVYFCKFGLLPARSHLRALSEQIEGGVLTRVLFAIGGPKGLKGYSSILQSVATDRPSNAFAKLIPGYYQRLGQPSGRPSQMWLHLKSRIEAFDLRTMRLRSNKRPLLDVILQTRTPAMIVEVGPAPDQLQ
jgi:hypothetical protein